ncbi:alpha/beta hydrolase [Marinicauda salina]|uniref:Alpha/beta hydrolase n=1 Tax=Marinicauda salina TaxID=2135793 RepID=A0A2U2BU22_9PROT|nr:alpha/beta fold hydrolase [Marinicauda salina]PWE17492.1 alpha/beta hydrolase [Marinicauda salina]
MDQGGGGLEIAVLGDLQVWREGRPAALPPSRKTRALLGFLAVTDRPHRRDRLCELFWDIPDDPRGALRWSLSKLRPLVNDPCAVRLMADRERVALSRERLVTDLERARAAIEADSISLEALDENVRRLGEPLLDGLDLPDQAYFQNWLTAERAEMEALYLKGVARCVRHPDQTPAGALAGARRWCEAAPLDPEAANTLLKALRAVGKTDEAGAVERETRRRFAEAGLAFEPEADAPADPQPVPTGRRLLQRQSIHFCTASDRVRIAYATVGQGPPLVKAANWLNHLELDWDAPIWSPIFRELARDHTFIRYDERGNGLSDWDVGDLSFDAFVSDLETVVDALKLERFPLLGISQGASVSIEYAIRHPGRVSHLILFGGYAAGWRVNATPEQIAEREAVITLTRQGWGANNPAYRQIFSSTFMPSASLEELNWFNEFQRQTTSAENAARFLTAFGDIDVRDRLEQVDVPTLVLHSRGDQRIPFETGRDIAARIPGAEFVPLESDAHLLLGRDPASQEFIAAIREFVDRT